MEKKRLMIGIPTKDHPKYIQFYLAKVQPLAEKYNIDIHIYDSSEDFQTEDVVKYRKKRGSKNVFYHRFPSSISQERKTGSILVDSEYEYIWLCGDAIVLNIEKSLPIVESEMDKKRDLIIISKQYKRSTIENVPIYKEYYDPIELIREQWGPISLCGGAIYKRDLFTKDEWTKLFPIYRDNIQLTGLFDIFYRKKMNVVALDTDLFSVNHYKKQGTWVANGNQLKVTVSHIPYSVNQLPSYYDSVKHEVSKLFFEDLKFYPFKNLWKVRGSGNISINKVFYYRKNIKKYVSTKWVAFFIMALIPRNFADKISKIFSD